MSICNSFESGFIVVDADEPELLNVLRSEIFAHASAVFNLQEQDPEIGFNTFHQHITEMPLGRLNEMRIELIRRITSECNARELIFNAFQKRIVDMLGPDILVQKNCNLVLQPPGDPNPSELHRDAPTNSPYEIVVWVPMVDCFGSKAMYILDIDASRRALDLLENNPTNWTEYENYAKSLAVRPAVAFGQALIFHTGCLHGSDINEEQETRVSLNLRYKNLFAPTGLKNQLQFFDVLRVSEVARLGSILEARELQN